MKKMILSGSPEGTGTQLCCDKYNMITHCLFIILLVLFLAILPLVGHAEMIVGTDIADRDIVDFYYGNTVQYTNFNNLIRFQSKTGDRY